MLLDLTPQELKLVERAIHDLTVAQNLDQEDSAAAERILDLIEKAPD